MSLARSAVRMYLIHAFGVILHVAATSVLGTVLPEPQALVVGVLIIIVCVLVGLLWHARSRGRSGPKPRLVPFVEAL